MQDRVSSTLTSTKSPTDDTRSIVADTREALPARAVIEHGEGYNIVNRLDCVW